MTLLELIVIWIVGVIGFLSTLVLLVALLASFMQASRADRETERDLPDWWMVQTARGVVRLHRQRRKTVAR